jgi:hypothetical protein
MREGQFWNALQADNPEAVIFDGPRGEQIFDGCVLGTASRKPWSLDVLVYDEAEMITTLMDVEGMDWEKATGWLCEHVFARWMGDGTPIIVRSVEKGEEQDVILSAEDWEDWLESMEGCPE